MNANSPEEFYSRIANDYEAITDAGGRAERDRTMLKSLLDRQPCRRVLDAGCGTGAHAILLAEMGLEVVGIDATPEMIRMARENAVSADARVDFRVGSIDQMPDDLGVSFDLVLCLGNTLPHLLTTGALRDCLRGFHNVLTPGGRLITQTLNYDRILSTRSRIVGTREHDGKMFVRFYDFLDEFIDFNVLVLERNSDGGWSHSLSTTRLRPVRSKELESLARNSGFREIKLSGSLGDVALMPDSTGLVLKAERMMEGPDN